MFEFLLPCMVVLGVVIGAVLATVLGRSRTAAQVDAAVNRAQAAGQVEIAQLRERLRSNDEIRDQVQTASGALRQEVGSLQNKVDELGQEAATLRERARNEEEGRVQAETEAQKLKRSFETIQEELEATGQELATLRERAAQVPTLVVERDALASQLRNSQEDGRRLSNEVSDQTASLRLFKERVSELLQRGDELERRLGAESASLAEANERVAALQEHASRVPELQRELEGTAQQLTAVQSQLNDLREASGSEISRLSTEVLREREAHGLVKDGLAVEKGAHSAALADVGRLNAELTDLKARSEKEQEAAAEKMQMLLDAKESLTDQFKSLANDILEEKSKRFAEQNSQTLGQLLTPLREQLTEFKGKVEEVYVQEGKDRSALSEQVKQLVGLNQTLSEDAKNLTQALKGSTKTQGNWGELVLERVLEASGLRKGHEYVVQDHQQREDGSRALPDVVIHLPEERRLVVDSKVSLLAYEQHISAESDEERALAVKRHLDSVRAHIRGLSDKKYQALYGIQSLDFVLMFVPIEPAFMMAVTHESNLFMEAWDRNVLLVSPSTLLFVVRTVAHLWRQEFQSRNAQDIAKRGAELYERLHDFVKDLEAVGTRLGQARDAYDSAHKRLSTGKGNVIRQAEMLRDLGVKPTKSLPAALVELAGVEREDSDPSIAEAGLSAASLVLGQGPEREAESAPA